MSSLDVGVWRWACPFLTVGLVRQTLIAAQVPQSRGKDKTQRTGSAPVPKGSPPRLSPCRRPRQRR
jgi:hypothetical protein